MPSKKWLQLLFAAVASAVAPHLADPTHVFTDPHVIQKSAAAAGVGALLFVLKSPWFAEDRKEENSPEGR